MKDDLVERLRSPYLPDASVGDFVAEAADVIEQLCEKSIRDDRTIEASVQTLEAMDKVNEGLREKLEKVRGVLEVVVSCDACVDCEMEAREALCALEDK